MKQRTIQLLSIALFVGLLTWGVFVTLVYLGVPVHGSVLLDSAAQESLNPLCQLNEFLCRGVYSLVPFVTNTLTRVPWVGWYALVSIVLYLLFLGWYAFRTGRFTLQLRFTPLKLFGLGILSMWLVFTTMSYMQTSDASIRRVVQPLPQVYQNAGAEALETLETNFQNLLDRGCLNHIGEFGNGANVYELKTLCVQKSFITRVMPQVLIVLVFLFELLIAGRFFLKLLRLKQDSPLIEMMTSIGLGVAFWIALIWLVAILGILHTPVGWALVLGIPAIGYKHTRYWLKKFYSGSWLVQMPWHSVTILLFWLLLSYLALNFLNVVRPFPIGWDDLGVYLNRPRLMVSYGAFIYSMASFQWEYLTSLGFLLFGYNSSFGATASMMINWTTGLLSVLLVYTFASTYLGKGRGILSALCYYMLPLVGHFSFADMKVDNAVFFMGALAVFALFLFLFPPDSDQKQEERGWQWILLAGIFIAYAFAMKATAIMVAMAMGAVLLGAYLHWSAFIATVLLIFGLFIKQENLSIADLTYRLGIAPDSVSKGAVLALFFGGGLLVLCAGGYLRRENIKRTAIAVGIFGAAFTASLSPWVTYNNIQQGSSLFSFQLKAPNVLTPEIDQFGNYYGQQRPEGSRPIHSLAPDLAVDNQHETCTPSGKVEELDRYWGFRKGWKHYFTLPWRSVMNIDSAGYYVTTMPALLFFPLLLLLPFFWMRAGRWLRWLVLGTSLMLLQWVFLANGIPWYGIGIFMGLAIGLETLVAKAPDVPNRTIVSILITLSLIACLGMRFWQFEQQRNLFEYAFGKVDAAALRERTIPHYDDISDLLVQRYEEMPDRPLLYRVGTFLPYFIPRNLEIIGISDHQLDVFNCIHQERDPKLTTARLKALGFNSIVFDTNTATIERDPNGSLHTKVNIFLEYLNNPESGLQLIINDTGAGVSFLLIP